MDISAALFNCVRSGHVLLNEPMSKHTSFKTGGPADYFVCPENLDELKRVIGILKSNNINYVVFGKGSNMLVSDMGIDGAVIYMGSFSQIKSDGNIITAGCGAGLSSIALNAFENSLTGFEFASGIPGTLGGAAFMNAGAYGNEMKDVIKWVRAIDDDLNEVKLFNNELGFGYRKSLISEKKLIIVEGCIELEEGEKDEILARMEELNKSRREKQPLNFPSAGSTFKRPEGYFAGKLIEESGLKGKSIGGAKVSEKHAGFIINTGNATTNDILELIKYCQNKVFEKFSVELVPEVRIIGRGL